MSAATTQWRFALALTVVLGTPAAGGAAAVQEAGEIAILQGLDKVTGRISTIEAPVGQTVSFGSLRIGVRSCFFTPPEEPPQRTAFLEIRDVRGGDQPVLVFSGWMFSSSPALSALEHPVYDVWVIDCRNASSSSGDNSR